MHDLGVTDAIIDDSDVARLWSESGARWLTDPSVPAPSGIVRRVLGPVEALDLRGIGLTDLVVGIALDMRSA